MVNLKRWAIVIFVLNSHISCQSLEHLKEKKPNPVACHHFDTGVSFVSRVNVQGNMKTAPAEFDVTFDFAIYLSSQKYDRKIERSNFVSSRFKIYVVFTSQMSLLMPKLYFILDRHFLKTCFCSS